MGSVVDYEECPKCKGVMMVDYYYRSGEEYQLCYRCGYHHSREMKRDEENKVILFMKDGVEVPEWNETVQEGYGSYLIMNHEGNGQGGGFNEPITDETIEELKNTFSRDDIDETGSYLARYTDGEFEVLLGNPSARSLLSFEDYFNESKHSEVAETTI